MMTSAQHNVFILDEAFYIPQLKRTRRIWTYLPRDYENSGKKYPVIYMHDGQNLFDEATAFSEEWEIDETLNSMLTDTIIVGIDNSEYRLNEYNFYDHEKHGRGDGKQYMTFIARTLKPFIDRHFRTMPQREFTHLAGSSMGGLISLYGTIYFAETFGGAGIFSPALWVVQDVIDELKKMAQRYKHYPQRFYFYGGAAEASDLVPHLNYVANMLKELPYCEVHVEINPVGEHSEFYWRNKFPDYYRWLKRQQKV